MRPAALFAILALSTPLTADETLQLERTIPLPGVEGRIDHFSLRAKDGILFVAGLGNGSVEQISLKEGKVLHEYTGLKEPQGVAAPPDSTALVVACGEDGTVRIYDTGSFEEVAKIDLGEDADNERLDLAAGRVWVGYASGGLASVDPASRKVVQRIKLPAHPEAFEIEPKGDRIFVNIPDAEQVAVVDRKKGEQVGTWRLDGAAKNFPMALDPAHHRLFVGCRQPACLVVLDTEGGKQVAKLECSQDVDDVWYDADLARLFLSCGQGMVDIFSQSGPDAYARVAQVKTGKGARTSLCVSGERLLYVAVPHRGDQAAEVRVYSWRAK